MENDGHLKAIFFDYEFSKIIDVFSKKHKKIRAVYNEIIILIIVFVKNSFYRVTFS